MTTVAVVGLSGRFPSADSARELWHNLFECRCAVGPRPSARDRYWNLGRLPEIASELGIVGGFLQDVEGFDPEFFGISPAEAMVMDPQQRLFLQEAWRAVEDAGYAAEDLAGKRGGVFVGTMLGEYHDLLTHAHGGSPKAHEVTNFSCFVAGRVAHFLNLRGPALSVDTASSSSLVALDMACTALRAGEIELALVGGVNLFLTEKCVRVLKGAGILSAAGECRPFDAGAKGTLPGEAVAAMVLKRLEDAVNDGDAIYGVIRSTGSNQDGRTPGITLPNAAAQQELMTEVLAKGEVKPAEVDYVEAHGTGTPKGDPVEAAALAAVFGGHASAGAKCRLGSIKANLGHAFSAAGMGSLIKVLGALQREQFAPQVNFEKLNPDIDEGTWPFVIGKEIFPWSAVAGRPRRAVVTGIGLTGTNAHCLVEEAPVKSSRSSTESPEGAWIVLSARTERALSQRAVDLLIWARSEGRQSVLVDIGFTLAVGRSAMGERAAFWARDSGDLISGLAILTGESKATDGPTIFKGRAANLDRSDSGLTGQWGESWVRGGVVDWRSIFEKFQPVRVHLPTYPFATDPYWYDRAGSMGQVKANEIPKAAA